MSNVDETGRSAKAPGWLVATSLLIAVIGIGVATYLTVAHFDEGLQLSCPDTGKIDCRKVTTSEQSYFLGMPVAVLGLAYFIAITAFLVPAAWRSQSRLVRLSRLLASGGGMLFVVWLIYAEMIKIHAICLYCTAVHVLTFLLFVVVLIGTAITAPYGGADDLDDDVEDDEDDEAEQDTEAGRFQRG
jgi:uncharacterized membrane protein